MKQLLRFSFVLLLAIFLVNCLVCVQAADFGFDTVPFPEDKSKEVLKNIDLEIFYADPPTGSVTCFDVGLSGNYALGINTSPGPTVCIYNPEGIFQYGYRFDYSSTYAVELTHENELAIYFNRSGYIATFDSKGECTGIFDVPDTKKNLNHIYDVIDCTHKTMDETTYYLDRDINWGTGYSRFIKVDEQGIVQVLYDVSLKHNIVSVIALLGLIAFTSFVTYKALAPYVARLRLEW